MYCTVTDVNLQTDQLFLNMDEKGPDFGHTHRANLTMSKAGTANEVPSQPRPQLSFRQNVGTQDLGDLSLRRCNYCLNINISMHITYLNVIHHNEKLSQAQIARPLQAPEAE